MKTSKEQRYNEQQKRTKQRTKWKKVLQNRAHPYLPQVHRVSLEDSVCLASETPKSLVLMLPQKMSTKSNIRPPHQVQEQASHQPQL